MFKFLFQANFADGSFIQQSQDDESATTPGKNSFYDVLQRIDDVVSFGLYSDDEDDHTYVVDLRDGHFELDGVPFNVNNDPKVPEDTQRRLIYFRTVTRHFNSGMQAVGVDMEFHFGWQSTVDGKNVQKIISVK